MQAVQLFAEILHAEGLQPVTQLKQLVTRQKRTPTFIKKRPSFL
jgi:hypothetical protein